VQSTGRIMSKYIFVRVVVGILALTTVSHTAHSAEIKVLSDGPLEPALTKIGEAFHRESAHTVTFGFGLSPAIHKRLTDGEVADVVLIQPNFVEELVKSGKLAPGDHPIIGRVGVGLYVRADTTAPDISTPAGLKEALLSADALVFSNVAAGNYFATILERLGISEAVKGKVTRTSPADVVTHILQGKGNDIGVGTITLILADRRLKLVGPLPGELQSYLVYAAAITNNAPSPDAGMEFIRFLASPAARAAFTAVGAN
jgi:molybdate transport system substrate-binding protein